MKNLKLKFISFELLAVGVVAVMISTAAAADPLPITSGYNQDVIANGSGSAADSTSATMDGFSVFFDSSYASDHGISGGAFPAGETATGSSSGVQYALPSASGDNALLLAASNDAYPNGAAGSATSGTLSFASIADVKTLYVLGTSTNGGSTLDYQLNFAEE